MFDSKELKNVAVGAGILLSSIGIASHTAEGAENNPQESDKIASSRTENFSEATALGAVAFMGLSGGTAAAFMGLGSSDSNAKLVARTLAGVAVGTGIGCYAAYSQRSVEGSSAVTQVGEVERYFTAEEAPASIIANFPEAPVTNYEAQPANQVIPSVEPVVALIENNTSAVQGSTASSAIQNAQGELAGVVAPSAGTILSWDHAAWWGSERCIEVNTTIERVIESQEVHRPLYFHPILKRWTGGGSYHTQQVIIPELNIPLSVRVGSHPFGVGDKINAKFYVDSSNQLVFWNATHVER